jgi:hypothetical protein
MPFLRFSCVRDLRIKGTFDIELDQSNGHLLIFHFLSPRKMTEVCWSLFFAFSNSGFRKTGAVPATRTLWSGASSINQLFCMVPRVLAVPTASSALHVSHRCHQPPFKPSICRNNLPMMKGHFKFSIKGFDRKLYTGNVVRLLKL